MGMLNCKLRSEYIVKPMMPIAESAFFKVLSIICCNNIRSVNSVYTDQHGDWNVGCCLVRCPSRESKPAHTINVTAQHAPPFFRQRLVQARCRHTGVPCGYEISTALQFRGESAFIVAMIVKVLSSGLYISLPDPSATSG